MPTINLGKKKKRDFNLRKQAAQDVYQNKLWKDLRKLKFMCNPICERCEGLGLTRVTEDVHHRKSIEAYPDLAFDWENLESLCHECHEIRHREMR